MGHFSFFFISYRENRRENALHQHGLCFRWSESPLPTWFFNQPIKRLWHFKIGRRKSRLGSKWRLVMGADGTWSFEFWKHYGILQGMFFIHISRISSIFDYFSKWNAPMVLLWNFEKSANMEKLWRKMKKTLQHFLKIYIGIYLKNVSCYSYKFHFNQIIHSKTKYEMNPIWKIQQENCVYPSFTLAKLFCQTISDKQLKHIIYAEINLQSNLFSPISVKQCNM